MSVVRESEVWAEIVAKTGQSKKEILAILTDPAASFGREWNVIQNYDKLPESKRPETIPMTASPIELPFQATKAVDWACVLNACFEKLFGYGHMSMHETSGYWAIFVKNVVDSECERHPLKRCTDVQKFALMCLLIDELRIDPRIPHQTASEIQLPILGPPEEEFTMRVLKNNDEVDLSSWTPEWATMWPEACLDTEFNCDPGGMGSPLAAHKSEVAMAESQRDLDQISEDVANRAKADELSARLSLIESVIAEERKSKRSMDEKATLAIKNAKAKDVEVVAAIMKERKEAVDEKLNESIASQAELEERSKEAEAKISPFVADSLIISLG